MIHRREKLVELATRPEHLVAASEPATAARAGARAASRGPARGAVPIFAEAVVAEAAGARAAFTRSGWALPDGGLHQRRSRIQRNSSCPFLQSRAAAAAAS
jgi:hypothetical protein